MKKHFLNRLTTLMAVPVLAATALLLLFLLLGWSTTRARPADAGPMPSVLAQSSIFTVSGTVTCQASGPISDVEVTLWNWDKSSVVASDTTDINGTYSLTLDEGTYYLEFLPSAATGLNAEAHTTLELITDTVLDIDFCVCSGTWISETVDGYHGSGATLDSSLALAPTDPYTPHISYLGLRHAWLSSTIWFTETVDFDGGKQTSLALAPTYPHTPCISYYDEYGSWGLKLAFWDSTTWITEVVRGGYHQGNGGTSLALAPTYPYTPHICYNLGFEIPGVRLTYLNGTAWMSGTWVEERVDNGPGGWSCSLALEPTYPYTPHISYATPSGLKHAWRWDTTWLTETVDSVGRVTSLALDSNDNPHASYRDITNLDLKYARKSGTIWFSETVDSDGDAGWYPSLALDRLDNPHISYFDKGHADLKYARFDGRVWIIQTVDGEVGQNSSLALDQVGCPHISYRDADSKEVKYAYILPYYVYLPLVMRNYP
jgi:hypothetical protein